MTNFKFKTDVNSIILNSASYRIAKQFFELLEKQFNAAEENRYEITLKYPGDFAAAMFVHINHLNKCLKDSTGRTTSQLIAERKIQEAKKLLQHAALTNESIRELLGFMEVAHFNRFFRKHAGISPAKFRRLVRNL